MKQPCRKDKKMRRVLTLSIIALFLSGCGNDPFGFRQKRSPDEFAVMPQTQPLSYPTSYELRSPEELKKYIRKKTQSEIAKSALGGKGEKTAVAGQSEDAFVSAVTKGQQADPNIREIVGQESDSRREILSPLGKKLIFWKDDPKRTSGEIVNPEEEAKKLREKNIPTPKPAQVEDVSDRPAGN